MNKKTRIGNLALIGWGYQPTKNRSTFTPYEQPPIDDDFKEAKSYASFLPGDANSLQYNLEIGDLKTARIRAICIGSNFSYCTNLLGNVTEEENFTEPSVNLNAIIQQLAGELNSLEFNLQIGDIEHAGKNLNCFEQNIYLAEIHSVGKIIESPSKQTTELMEKYRNLKTAYVKLKSPSHTQN